MTIMSRLMARMYKLPPRKRTILRVERVSKCRCRMA